MDDGGGQDEDKDRIKEGRVFNQVVVNITISPFKNTAVKIANYIP